MLQILGKFFFHANITTWNEDELTRDQRIDESRPLGLGGGAPPTPPPLPPLKGAPGISPWLMGFEVLVLVVHLLLVLLVDLVVLDLDLLPQS